MRTVNIYAAKTQLSRLVDEALRGEEVVIARDNQPLVKLVPIRPADTHPRRLGSARGTIRLADDFDAPLPEMKEYEPET